MGGSAGSPLTPSPPIYTNKGLKAACTGPQRPCRAGMANPWQSPVHPCWYKPLTLSSRSHARRSPVRTFSGITRYIRANTAKCEHKVPRERARATPVDHANASGAVTPRCGRELRTHARLVQTPKGNQLVQRPSLKLTMCSSKADHRRAQQRTSGKGACKTNGSCFLASRRHFALRSGNHKISTHTFHKRNHHARGQAVHLKRAPHNVG